MKLCQGIVLLAASCWIFLAWTSENKEPSKKDAASEALAHFKKLGGTISRITEAPGTAREALMKSNTEGFMVDLSGTKVSDEDLLKLQFLQPVITLDLSNTNITGKGLGTVADLGEVLSLWISYTKISDEDAVVLAKLTKLRVLVVSYTDFGEKGLKAVAENCPRLLNLDCFQSAIPPRSPSFLTNARELEELNLGKSKVSNDDIVFIRKMPKLRVLWIAETSTGPGIGKILRGTKLEDISLKGTKISDEDLFNIRYIETLKHLNLENTRVTDKGVVELVDLPKLIGLRLAGTKVTSRARDILHKKTPDIGFYSLPYEEGK